MPSSHSLVLDIGTTGVKAFVFDNKLNVVSKSYLRLNKSHPKNGWVEQSPKEIIKKSISVMGSAIKEARAPLIGFSGLGITNQRETTILWDKETGTPIYPAIVWEDARTSNECSALKSRHQNLIKNKTGLSIDPYFSATKISWILKNVPKAQKLVDNERLLFGTVDAWVIWNLTQEKIHATDYTNASRTLLFNIKTLKWDEKLLKIFNVPISILPEIKHSRENYGHLKSTIVGAPLPILAVCGDQQASMYGAGKISGTTKATYGTGIFIMQNLGPSFRASKYFFTTLVPNKPKPNYALEAKIENSAEKIDALLKKNKNLNPLIKKFAQKVDVYLKRLPRKPKVLIVDGGITQAPDLTRIQSEISGIPVKRQKIYDGTALGVAKLMKE
ncbi:hypothetical protein KKH05_01485 [Patescibacteria group bacterium]|nr:hypothetical protein [Patescibacteria group bacterium]